MLSFVLKRVCIFIKNNNTMILNEAKLENGITYADVNFECTIETGDTNNCTVRALASAFEVNYRTANNGSKMLWNREYRQGVSLFDVMRLGDMGSLWGKKITQLGEMQDGRKQLGKMYHVGAGMKKFRRMSTGTFFKEYACGTYYVVVSGHAFTVKDGKVMGNHADATMLKRPITVAYKIK